MVTIEELDQYEKTLQEKEKEITPIANQPIPKRRFHSGITAEYQQKVIQQKEKAQQVLNQIQQERSNIQQQKQSIAQEQDRIDKLKVYYRMGKEGKPFPNNLTKSQREAYNAGANSNMKYIEQQSSSSTESIPVAPEGYVIQSTAQGYRAVSIKNPNESYLLQGKSTAQGVVYEGIDERYSVPSRTVGRNNINNSNNLSSNKEVQGVESAPEEPKGILSKWEAQAVKERHTSSNDFIKFKAGLIETGVSFAKGLKSVFTTNPITTAKNVVVGTYQAGKKAVTTGYPEIGKMLREEPAYSTGRIGGEVALWYGQELFFTKAIPKSVDYFRTKGRIDLPTEDIVAPEYFKGQSYPKISKGETAGELLAEFNQEEIYGVTRLRGFHATRFPSIGETIEVGSSELPGLYQAPKVSPKFLRISGESETKLFGLNPIGTLRPTVLKVEPKAFELVPNVEKNLAKPIGFNLDTVKFFGGGALPLKYTTKVTEEGGEIIGFGYVAGKKKYIMTKFPTRETEVGKAYIPFQKTEKEAILAAKTPIVKTGSRLYFEFEDRKVPINEYKVVSLAKTTSLGKIETLGSVYSRYKNNPRAIVNPYNSVIYGSRSKPNYSYDSTVKSYSSSISSSISKSSVLLSYQSLSYSTRKISYRKLYHNYSYTNNVPSSNYDFKSFTYYPRIEPPTKHSYLYPPIKTPKIIPPPSKINVPKNNKINYNNDLAVRGYRTFIIRGGKRQYLPGVRTKGKALNYGQDIAKFTLRATFGAEPTSQLVSGKDITFAPDKKLFRSFRIQHGKKIPLQNEFIQRKGKRLASYGELSEINAARMIAR